MEWLVMLPERRLEFAERPAYLGIMNSMIDQGTDPTTPGLSATPNGSRSPSVNHDVSNASARSQTPRARVDDGRARARRCARCLCR